MGRHLIFALKKVREKRKKEEEWMERKKMRGRNYELFVLAAAAKQGCLVAAAADFEALLEFSRVF